MPVPFAVKHIVRHLLPVLRWDYAPAARNMWVKIRNIMTWWNILIVHCCMYCCRFIGVVRMQHTSTLVRSPQMIINVQPAGTRQICPLRMYQTLNIPGKLLNNSLVNCHQKAVTLLTNLHIVLQSSLKRNKRRILSTVSRLWTLLSNRKQWHRLQLYVLPQGSVLVHPQVLVQKGEILLWKVIFND